jgi:hypothetical protein
VAAAEPAAKAIGPRASATAPGAPAAGTALPDGALPPDSALPPESAADMPAGLAGADHDQPEVPHATR